MITLEQLLASMRHENEVIKHLGTKVASSALSYRPTPGQRSLEELLKYMTRMAIVPTVYAIDGNWDRAVPFEQESEDMDVARFAEEMDRQFMMIEEELSSVDETEATTRPSAMPWGTPVPLSAGLMDMALKTYVAYRMQLFLYLKASGVQGLGPLNCWLGVDAPTECG